MSVSIKNNPVVISGATRIGPQPGASDPIIVTSGLSLHYDFANGSYSGSGTTITDLSGNGRTGTTVGSPAYTSSGGGYISFNGSNQYITCNKDACFAGTGDFTYSSWFYLPSNLTYLGNFGFYAATLISSNTLNGLEFFIASSGSGTAVPTILKMGQYGKAVNVSATGLSIPLTAWHEVTMKRQSGTSTIYLDGSVVGSGAGLSGVSYAAPASLTYFGSSATPNYLGAITGYFSSIKMYNRALSDNEVLQNFNATRGRFGI
jgi:hypothetical protein